MQKLRAGILGATGAVGQQFVRLLADHPWFDISVLAASERSAGKRYFEAVNWIGSDPIPDSVREMEVVSCEPGIGCDFVFSGLDAKVAGGIESDFAAAGYAVISNARNHRMRQDVPLLIPEVNPEHTALIDAQNTSGYIVTNPNCSTVGLVCALKPIVDAFGVDRVQVSTMQALSGAGYPGVSSLDILGNVVPFIGGEEDKLETEPLKLLGALENGAVTPYRATLSAQCNRVPVLDGHMETVSLSLKRTASPEAVVGALRGFKNPLAGLGLPTAPDPFVAVFDDPRFPQPRRHSNLGRGMTVSVGRVRSCNVLDIRMVVLSHNTVRGAAGGAILNAELLVHQGRLSSRTAAAPATEKAS
ncbi:MAG: aspartate-semialdehyde dehydrogenase [Rhodothermales bacterium]|nr:aspartate-semialdehyde dehydrogenase [Rhodothermales bacterium]MBO6779798.1 aspartate-semialdehyde dehydrogenase [Rhodothermales bacterium]